MIPRYQQGIEFNGSHSFRDLRLTVKSRTIGNPKKKKNLVQVPFTNQEYDLSEVYGLQTYENRQLTYILNVINLKTNSKQDMNSLKIKVLNEWFPAPQYTVLIDDALPEFYFLAEIREAPTFTEKAGRGELTVVFECYPFKLTKAEQPNDDWDIFDFSLDVAQNRWHKVSEQTKLLVVNLSLNTVRPKYISTRDVDVKVKGKLYNLKKGTNLECPFILDRGDNFLEFLGDSRFSLTWKREVI